MLNYPKNLLALFLLLFFSCKKEVYDPTLNSSQRSINLTKHKWSMTHEYVDSTSYAKNNLNLWPLNTTDDFMSIYDTCGWDSKSVFLTNGKCQLLKSAACDSSVSSDVGYWKLINNENDFVFVGQDTMHIIELTPNDFKMWYKINTYVSGQLVLTEYCMWTFKSSN
jgi:hypothetical protein